MVKKSLSPRLRESSFEIGVPNGFSPTKTVRNRHTMKLQEQNEKVMIEMKQTF